MEGVGHECSHGKKHKTSLVQTCPRMSCRVGLHCGKCNSGDGNQEFKGIGASWWTSARTLWRTNRRSITTKRYGPSKVQGTGEWLQHSEREEHNRTDEGRQQNKSARRTLPWRYEITANHSNKIGKRTMWSRRSCDEVHWCKVLGSWRWTRGREAWRQDLLRRGPIKIKWDAVLENENWLIVQNVEGKRCSLKQSKNRSKHIKWF